VVGKVLVTTALEETWPKNGEPTLFLGEWCRIYTRSEQFGQINGEVADYHWDDREKLYRDYLWLDELYESALLCLTQKLNEIHGVNHSVRYWRILVGPWLGYFIHILFDRWFMLNTAVEKYKITECNIIKRDWDSFIPNDTFDFDYYFKRSDEWNEGLYSKILNIMFSHRVNLSLIECSPFNDSLKANSEVDIKKKCTRQLVNFVNKISLGTERFFFQSTYLTPVVNLLLQLRLKQWPKIYGAIDVRSKYTPLMSMRRWELNDLKTEYHHPCAQLVSFLASRYLPMAYLEGYNDLSERSCLGRPSNPHVIFTSNSYWVDDAFKAYAAIKVDSGSKLVVGQHGGHYGMSPFSFNEKHQIDIADRWLSWGWDDRSRTNIFSIGNFREWNHFISYDPLGYALMVEMSLPRYSYHMYAIPVARQWLDYFDEQKRFVSSLLSSLHGQLNIRLVPTDYGWCQFERWKDAFPKINLDQGKVNIRDQVKKCRLYISTYNATTYLESLAWNVPTIIFWKPEHWELKPEVIPYFDMLQSVGIFHKSPENAARKMIEVWDDVDEWWKSKEVQEARNTFCEQFSYIPKNLVDRLVSSMEFDRAESNT
jgi:putative transferase (TIGR04331 family)